MNKRIKKGCKLCKNLSSGDFSGSKGLVTYDFPMTEDHLKEQICAEILDERTVANRQCFTLVLSDDYASYPIDLPIKFCPMCGRNLYGIA